MPLLHSDVANASTCPSTIASIGLSLALLHLQLPWYKETDTNARGHLDYLRNEQNVTETLMFKTKSTYFARNPSISFNNIGNQTCFA